MSLKGASALAHTAAALLVATHVLQMGAFAVVYKHSNLTDSITREQYHNMNPEIIQDEWELRRDYFVLGLVSSFFKAFSWVLVGIVLVHLAWILSNGATRMLTVHIVMAMLAVGASFCDGLAWLMLVGAETTALIIRNRFNLANWTGSDDEIGWRVLEISYKLVSGIVVWVDAFEYLMLSVILILIFWSVKKQGEARTFSIRWNKFGLILAFLCVFHFAFDVMRLFNWYTFSPFAMFFALVTRLLFMPIWLVWLGRQLRSVDLPMIDGKTGPPTPASYGSAADDEVVLD